MTQEEKELLFKDLCARLPYGVKFLRESWNYEWDQEMSVVETLEDIDNERYINHTRVYKVEDINPYLRPMSSMTEEEKETLLTLKWTKLEHHTVDWLNQHYLDYRDLIGKGIALPAPEGMYIIK